jgi:hypothetical protein|tara:strand:- start:2265 stop:2693 length:429 start_codon:yes stop_codon:yes gene_type:complete
MSWVFNIAAAQQAKASGKYNQAVQERNATIAEQEAGMVEKQLEFDINRFDQQFVQLQGETKTSIYKSGVEMSGSGLRVLRYNAEQAEIQKDVMDYNAKVTQGKKLEEANFARIQGQVARQQAKAAEYAQYAKAGESLMKQYG